MWNPKIQQMATLIIIQHKRETSINGAVKTDWVDATPPAAFCNWKYKNDLETVQSGVLSATETVTLTLWYRPDITLKSRVLLDGNFQKAYEVVHVENVEQRGQFLVLKVKKTKNA